MKRKTACIVVGALAVLLCFGALLFLRRDKEQKSNISEQTAQQILASWDDYLRAEEQLLAGEKWAVDAFVRFGDSRSWEDLCRARAAASVLAAAIPEIEAPSLALTSEELALLQADGLDLWEYAEFPAIWESEREGVRILAMELKREVLVRSLIEPLLKYAMKRMETRQLRLELERQYAVMSTNMLILTLGKDGAGAWDRFRTAYPGLFAEVPAFEEDSEALRLAISRNIEQTERLEDDLAREEAESALTYQSLRAMTHEELYASFTMDRSAVPALLPLPDWVGDFIASGRDFTVLAFLMKDDEPVVPALLDPMETAPAGASYRFSQVSLEEYVDYTLLLAQAGCRLEWAEEAEAGTFEQYALLDSSVLCLKWSEEALVIHTLGEPVCLIPNYLLFP